MYRCCDNLLSTLKLVRSSILSEVGAIIEATGSQFSSWWGHRSWAKVALSEGQPAINPQVGEAFGPKRRWRFHRGDRLSTPVLVSLSVLSEVGAISEATCAHSVRWRQCWQMRVYGGGFSQIIPKKYTERCKQRI